jgi:hypothetical protein
MNHIDEFLQYLECMIIAFEDEVDAVVGMEVICGDYRYVFNGLRFEQHEREE